MDKFKLIATLKKGHLLGEKVYTNNKYQVNVKETETGVTHLSIKAKNKQAIHDWRDFQVIKNEICGEEREGCEIYPAESRLVDSSNQYHIFVLPKGEKMPFGYVERFIVEGHKKNEGAGSVQRPFKTKPKGVVSVEEAVKRAKEYWDKHNKE
jgi:hypothetical protein